jgi:hypothetical protein
LVIATGGSATRPTGSGRGGGTIIAFSTEPFKRAKNATRIKGFAPMFDAPGAAVYRALALSLD